MTRTANDGNVILSGVPEIPADISERLRPYQNTRFAMFMDWTQNGDGVYVSTRFGNVPQIHRVSQPGGMRRQMTFEKEPIREGWRRPLHPELLYLIDIGGGEFYQLILFDPHTGRSRMLTDGASRNVSPVWSPDGERLLSPAPGETGDQTMSG